ncbi:MAG: GNAT family N-acetyltransferase [Clostridium sp.]|nr:GNAT family N-acetyltransferase [Clostridium sp.]
MEIRKIKSSDIDILIDNRLEFVCSIRNVKNIEEFRIHTRRYIEKHLEDNSLIAFIAVDNGKIVSSSILCIYETLPVPSCLNGKTGLLLNVYTLKEYRHQGLAGRLLIKIVEEAKKLEVVKIQLDYTDDGYQLYKKMGFKRLDREMILKL